MSASRQVWFLIASALVRSGLSPLLLIVIPFDLLSICYCPPPVMTKYADFKRKVKSGR